MIVAHRPEELAEIRGPLALTLGVFDGCHRGHQALFGTLLEEARDAKAQSLVVTFDPHPLEVLHPEVAPRLLTTGAERVDLLSRWGIDSVFVVPFSREMAALSAEEFLRWVTPPEATLRRLVIGFDFRMGRDRSGGLEELRALGAAAGFQVRSVAPVKGEGEPVSSTRIRGLLAEGRVKEAADLLGHRYLLAGKVQPGRGVGKTLQFPTANVDIRNARKVLPRGGVYAVRVRVGESPEWRSGVANLGVRPTFGLKDLALEVHLLDFEGSVAEETLWIEFVDRLRDEIRFDGIEALREQIVRDVETARDRLSAEECGPRESPCRSVRGSARVPPNYEDVEEA